MLVTWPSFLDTEHLSGTALQNSMKLGLSKKTAMNWTDFANSTKLYRIRKTNIPVFVTNAKGQAQRFSVTGFDGKTVSRKLR